MRIVLDSSVLIAAAISRGGVCAALLEDLLINHELVISQYILEEISRKLEQKFDYPHSEIRQLHRFLSKVAVVVVPVEVPRTTCRDPADLPVLGTAVAGDARLLVSVDKDLLTIGEYQGIAIIRPGHFWLRSAG